MEQTYLKWFSLTPAFPTDAHRLAAEAVVDYFASDSRVQAVLLTCSCARGMASPDSCVDIAVLVPPEALASFNEGEQHERAASFLASDPACMDLASSTSVRHRPGFLLWRIRAH